MLKGLVWHGVRDVRYEDLPDPAHDVETAVLEVSIAGVCGSDLHGFRGHPGPRIPPLVLGHEVVGIHAGCNYTVYPIIGCGDCPRCDAGQDNLCADWQLIGMHAAGVFAEKVRVPLKALVPLPEDVDPRAAVLAEPLACCVGALAPKGVAEGMNVVVLGCGPIGLLTTFLAARAGADVTAIDPVPERREIARMLGATRFTPVPGTADLVVDAAGFASTWGEAIGVVRTGGDVVVLGLGETEGSLPLAAIVRRAVHIRGQFGYTRAEFAESVRILAEGSLDLSWVTEVPLADGADAFANLVDEPASFHKVLLRP